MIYAIIVRACKVKSRHVILRLKFNHAKTSIWLDSLPKVLNLCFPHLNVMHNSSDFYITLPNGSEIWIAGLDDKLRTEKILGKEYSTIGFNECSQIPLDSVSVALTRLAEKNKLSKKAYYDENPPSKKHWSYWMFIKHWHPTKEVDLDPAKYASIMMNPMDNMENIDEEYVTEVLDELAENDVRRFKWGEFLDSDDGFCYYTFDREKHVEKIERRTEAIFIAQDFNVDPLAGVVCEYYDATFHIIDEVFLRNSDTYQLCKHIKRHFPNDYVRIIPDSTARNRKTSGKSDIVIMEHEGFEVMRTRNPYVTDRVNNINRLLEKGRIKIDPKCKKLINDLEQVSWREGKVEIDQKTNRLLSHVSDALGYLCWKLEPLRFTKGVTILRH